MANAGYPDAVSEPSDQDLVRAYVEAGSDSAFQRLVLRYVDLVHSVALRLVRDPHLAEDVSQAVFLTLANDAKRLSHKLASGVPLSGWLHLTTRNLAIKTVRTESRRRSRERIAATMESSTSTEPVWEQLAPHLDEALASLPEPDRHALLLRFFEKRTAREIGSRLGWSEDGAQKRVTRALEKLRQQFRTAGVGVSVAGLIAALGAHAVHAAPVGLGAKICAGVIQTSAGAAAGIGSSVFCKFTSTVLMTKSQAVILSGAALLAAIPLARQQHLLSASAAQLTSARQAAALAEPKTPLARPAPAPSDTTELEQLRRQVQDLQLQLSNAQRSVSRPAGPQGKAGPVQLLPGQVVRTQDLVFAGAETPEAALQSYLALQRDGDIEGAFGLMLQSIPNEEARMLETDEGREQIKAAMRAEVQPIQSVELLEQRPISERRTQLLFREFRGDRVVTNTFNLGRAVDGWKLTL